MPLTTDLVICGQNAVEWYVDRSTRSDVTMKVHWVVKLTVKMSVWLRAKFHCQRKCCQYQLVTATQQHWLVMATFSSGTHFESVTSVVQLFSAVNMYAVNSVITPPTVGWRGIVFGRFLSFFVYLFLCQQHYEKTAGPICMKFSAKVWSDHGTTWLNFGPIRVNGSAGQRSICWLSPAVAQS